MSKYTYGVVKVSLPDWDQGQLETEHEFNSAEDAINYKDMLEDGNNNDDVFYEVTVSRAK